MTEPVWGVVLVGLDGSAEARAALTHAVAEADRRVARLRVAVAIDDSPEPVLGHRAASHSAAVDDELRRLAHQRVRDALPEGTPLPDYEVFVYCGPAASALITASERADLLVVGHHHRGPTDTTSEASVAAQCVEYARCPVTVVHGAATSAHARVR